MYGCVCDKATFTLMVGEKKFCINTVIKANLAARRKGERRFRPHHSDCYGEPFVPEYLKL